MRYVFKNKEMTTVSSNYILVEKNKQQDQKKPQI